MSNTKMQAPKGNRGQAANIEGHEYKIPETGIIKVVSPLHIDTLKRHGFVEILEDENLENTVDSMDDKDELVAFIEERGGDADNTMSFKKLRRLAKEAAAPKNEDED